MSVIRDSKYNGYNYIAYEKITKNPEKKVTKKCCVIFFHKVKKGDSYILSQTQVSLRSWGKPDWIYQAYKLFVKKSYKNEVILT